MTAQDLIDSALRLIGELATQQSPTATESGDALETLNHILETWSAEGLPIPYATTETFTLTGAAEYTIGTGGTWPTTRPLSILAANVISSNQVTREVDLVDAHQWGGLRDKTRTGTFAEKLYYSAGYPTGTVKLWPRPTTGTLELYSFKALEAFPTLGTTIDMPPGYEKALRFALAVDLAPEHGRVPIPASLSEQAIRAKAALTNLNLQVLGAAKPASIEEPTKP
jgi:hypothetical protein